MKLPALILLFLFIGLKPSFAQSYQPVIEISPRFIKTDPKLVTKYGYLVVPENRAKANGRKIKIPFVFVRRPDSDAKKNITLFTTGGPGYSSTANIDSIGYDSGFLKFGGFIVFDQRGTKRAKPCLDCDEVDLAIKRSYKEGLNKQALVIAAAKRCRDRLSAQGIDLSAYNTIESAEDINDLRLALHIDSLNLFGMSYSGGLMLTVTRNHPEGVHALILGSPLPGYVNYEEHGLFNINEALDQVFDDLVLDSANAVKYPNLKSRFHQYFTAVTGKKFSISYLEKGTKDSIKVNYTKNELLDAVINRLNTSQVKTVPMVIDELITGKHAQYIREVLDAKFSGDKKLSLGMRYSIYCSEQIAYSDPALEKQQALILPWLAGYEFNNVDHVINDCWKITPEPKIAKTPVYSTIPAIIAAGDIDPWCRPFYNRLIKRYMPNAQLLIVHGRGHTPGFTVDGIDYVKIFLDNPLIKMVSKSKNLIIE